MITPQQAQELLRGDFDTEKHTERLGNSQADFDSFTGAYIRSTPGDIALAEAAPELAELVASMYFMYAVQIEDVDGGIWFAKSELAPTSDIRNAWWTSAPNTTLADRWRERKIVADVRIVRRLMADPEVAE